jgi:hypothetical protein
MCCRLYLITQQLRKWMQWIMLTPAQRKTLAVAASHLHHQFYPGIMRDSYVTSVQALRVVHFFGLIRVATCYIMPLMLWTPVRNQSSDLCDSIGNFCFDASVPILGYKSPSWWAVLVAGKGSKIAF